MERRQEPDHFILFKLAAAVLFFPFVWFAYGVVPMWIGQACPACSSVDIWWTLLIGAPVVAVVIVGAFAGGVYLVERRKRHPR